MTPTPSFFERFGERVLLLIVGPMDRIQQLYARGPARFALTRGAGYATIMLVGLILMNLLAGVPLFRSDVDKGPLLIRYASYWIAQFVLGSLLSLFIWRMVKRIAEYRAKMGTPQSR